MATEIQFHFCRSDGLVQHETFHEVVVPKVGEWVTFDLVEGSPFHHYTFVVESVTYAYVDRGLRRIDVDLTPGEGPVASVDQT